MFHIPSFDLSVDSVHPRTVNNHKGISVFDPSLALVLCAASALFCSACGGAWAYTLLRSQYDHVSVFIGGQCHLRPAWCGRIFFTDHGWPSRLKSFGPSDGASVFDTILLCLELVPVELSSGSGPAPLMSAFAVSAILNHILLRGMRN
jgi:hypothetical protein